MLDFEELSKYYTDFISANTNPYQLVSKQVFKKNGEIKSITEQKLIKLEEINPKDLILKSSNKEEIEYYPKSFFKKIFGKKVKIDINIEKNEEYFIITSIKTKKIVNTNCVIYDSLEEDNKIILVKRGKLIYHILEDKIYSFTDSESIEYNII